MKLFHTSDIHLGKRRLGGKLPDQDLADAFAFIADRAIDERADVFLLAGDLFDRPQVEPPHLRQAEQILSRLKEARIPVIAIEGNHDKALIHSDVPTWVRYLADDDLLMLLRPEFDAEGAVLSPWNPESKKGALVTIDGVRFVGAGYLGAATPGKVRQIVTGLDDEVPNVLLLHAGPDYFVGEGGGFSEEDLAAIQEKICYLALGHIHKPMVHADWACNPGSPENCDLSEASYGQDLLGNEKGRGYAVVEIDPDSPGAPSSLELRSNPRRRCIRLELSCTHLGKREKLIDAAVELIRESGISAETVVELRLIGVLNLNRIALDPGEAADEISQRAGAFAVSIDPSGLNVPLSSHQSNSEEQPQMSREDLERRAIGLVLEDHPVPGLEDRRQDLVELFFDLKEGVRLKEAPGNLAEKLLNHPLVAEAQRSQKDDIDRSHSPDSEALRAPVEAADSSDSPSSAPPSPGAKSTAEIRSILTGK